MGLSMFFYGFCRFIAPKKNKKKQAIKTVAAHQIFRLLVAKFHHGTRQGWHLRHNKTREPGAPKVMEKVVDKDL